MPVLAAMSSNCGFYYIPNFLLLPLPSAWFITVEEQYRCHFNSSFIISGPPDSYFLRMHHCFAGCGCQLTFLHLVCHGIVNHLYFTSFFSTNTPLFLLGWKERWGERYVLEGFGITCLKLALRFVFQIYRQYKVYQIYSLLHTSISKNMAPFILSEFGRMTRFTYCLEMSYSHSNLLQGLNTVCMNVKSKVKSWA